MEKVATSMFLWGSDTKLYVEYPGPILDAYCVWV